MNLETLKIPYLNLLLEQKRILILSIRESRLQIKKKSTNKVKSKVARAKKVKSIEDMTEKEIEKRIESIIKLLEERKNAKEKKTNS